MQWDMDKIVEEGILTPIADLTLSEEDKSQYDEGFVFDKTPDILTRGHVTSREDKIATRLESSNYLINPTKWSVDKMFRIVALVFRFLRSFKCRRMFTRDFLHRFNVLKVSRINSEFVTKLVPLIPSLFGTGRGFSVSGPLSTFLLEACRRSLMWTSRILSSSVMLSMTFPRW